MPKRAKKALPKSITRDEADRLLAVPSRRSRTGKRNRAIMAAMYFAGLRVSEVVGSPELDDRRRRTGRHVGGLAPADLRPQADPPRMIVRQGKGSKDRIVGMNRELREALEPWIKVRAELPDSQWLFCTLDGGPMDPRYVHAMVQRAAVEAGVYKLTDDNERVPINPHILRHSFATSKLADGMNVYKLQRALGHSALSTTQVYLHATDDEVAAAMVAEPEPVEPAVEPEPDLDVAALVRAEVARQLEAAA